MYPRGTNDGPADWTRRDRRDRRDGTDLTLWIQRGGMETETGRKWDRTTVMEQSSTRAGRDPYKLACNSIARQQM